MFGESIKILVSGCSVGVEHAKMNRPGMAESILLMVGMLNIKNRVLSLTGEYKKSDPVSGVASYYGCIVLPSLSLKRYSKYL